MLGKRKSFPLYLLQGLAQPSTVNHLDLSTSGTHWYENKQTADEFEFKTIEIEFTQILIFSRMLYRQKL